MAYQKQTFTDNVTVLNADMMNHIEDGIVSVENGAPVQATATTLGLVKQAQAVAEASGGNVTGAEFKALLDALKNAGIMATE